MTSSRIARILSATEAELNLAEAALLIAELEYPDLDVARYLGRLDELARDIRQRLGGEDSPLAKLRAMNRYLFEEQGFAGNSEHYYDPRNSYLNEVLDRRLGIPITLSVIYMEVGRRLGLALEGVSFPGHFLVKYRLEDGEVVLDPYHGGASLTLEDLRERASDAYGSEPEDWLLADMLAGASKRDILARMLRNLKSAYGEREDHARLLSVQDLLVRLAPDDPEELRERAVLYERVGHTRAALADFRRYLDLAPDSEHAPEVARRVETLAGQGPRLH
jgi:regulator of sirC expression with transglutaminase-like and TPR domain